MVFSMTCILAFTLFLIFGSINLYFHFFYDDQSEGVLTKLMENGGHRGPFPGNLKNDIPPPGMIPDGIDARAVPPLPDGTFPPREQPGFKMDGHMPPKGWYGLQMMFPHDEFDLYDYFSITMDGSGRRTGVISDYRLRYDDSLYDTYAQISYHGLTEGKMSGIYNGIRWKIRKSDSSYFTACVNIQNTIAMQIWLLRLSLILYAVCVLLSYFLAMLFSKWAIAPVRKTLSEQKQFIADAGHELKTPIAVIGANVDLLMSSMGGNKWLQYIKTENERLGQLVKDLLYLAHSDSGRAKIEKTDFDLGTMAEGVVLPFESIVYEQGKMLEMNITRNIHIRADETSLKEVVIVLVDNAIKNTDKGALIKVSVYASGTQRFIKVYNTGKGVRPEELEKIFLRFYRSDVSRARNTGGSGLGLSIAQAIVLNHNGTIKADSEYGKWVEFTVRLPEK